MRNRLNSKIVIDMAVALKAAGFTSVLYFAQNEHIGRFIRSSHSMLVGPIFYLTDGHYISESKKVSYTAVATCGPMIWNTWIGGKPRLHRCKIWFKKKSSINLCT